MLVTTAVLNLALDPWFIYGGFGLPAMGLAGVAWATVLLQGAGAVYLGFKARRTGLLATARGPQPDPPARHIRQHRPAGIPGGPQLHDHRPRVLRHLPLRLPFGPEASAAFGIATRLDQVILMPAIGLNVAALTITAQNYGAGDMARIRETLSRCLRYGARLLLPLCVPLGLFAGPLMRLFSDDPAVVEVGAQYLRVDAFVLYGYVVISVSTAALQGMQRPLFAIWMGLGRQVLAPWLLFTLLVNVLGCGTLALWLSIAAIVWTAALTAFWFVRRTMARTEARSG